MELKVKVNHEVGVISSNFEEIKSQVEASISIYKGVIVTEETVKNSKKDIAELRKAKKVIDDKRKEIKKTFMEPFAEFENQCKQIMNIIDEPIGLLEYQTKEFEAQKRKEKHDSNVCTYEEMTAGYREYLPISKYYRDSWDNSTTNSKTVKDEIGQLIEIVKIGISTIQTIESDYQDKGLEEFKANLNVANAIQKIKALEKQRDEIIERERAKKEREEQERIRREEEGIRREEEIARQQAERGKIFDEETGTLFEEEDAAFETEETEELAFEPIKVFNITFRIKEINEEQVKIVEEFLHRLFIDYEVEEE